MKTTQHERTWGEEEKAGYREKFERKNHVMKRKKCNSREIRAFPWGRMFMTRPTLPRVHEGIAQVQKFGLLESRDPVAYRGWGRGAIRSGRHSGRGGKKKGEWKKKKRKKGKRKEREKRKKKEKENMGEACNNSETKMEHLSCGAPMHLTFWRSKPYRRGRVVRLYVLLHRAPKFIGSYTFWRL